MSKQGLVVARREFKERVFTKWYVFGLILGPIGMLAMAIIPAILAAKTPPPHIAVVSASTEIAESLAKELRDQAWEVDVLPDDASGSDDALLSRVRADQVDGFLRIPADAVDGGEIRYQGINATSMLIQGILRTEVSKIVIAARARRANLNEAQVMALFTPVAFETQQTSGDKGGAGGGAAMFVGLAAMLMIFYAIIFFASNVMRGVVEEKTSRVGEVMAATCRPAALLGGKIVGVGMAGLLQLAGWVSVGLVALYFRGSIVEALTGKAAGEIAIPEIGVLGVAIVAVYFLLGYFFYASLYAAVGAMVSSEQEAQQAQTPIMLSLMTGMLAFQVVAGNPRGEAAQLLTQLPLTSPLLMPMRYLVGGASFMNVITSIALLVVATLGAAWIAHRIYRIGMLSYGKKPSWREVLAWIRQG